VQVEARKAKIFESWSRTFGTHMSEICQSGQPEFARGEKYSTKSNFPFTHVSWGLYASLEPKARIRVFVWNWGIVARISTPSLHLCVPPIQFSPIPRTLDLSLSLSLSLSATVHTDVRVLRPPLHLELRPGDIVIVSAKSSPSSPPSAGQLQALSARTTPLLRLRCRGQEVLHWVYYFCASSNSI
jgi:hypothetical protein